MTAAAIVEAYNLIGYDAVCVGSQDLIAGLPYLKGLRKGAKFTWLSANLVSKKTKKQIFKSSISVKLGTIKAGVIGLTGAATLAASDDANILPWDQVLPALVDKMAKKNDLLILLSNLPPADNQRIAETMPGIHLIIQSGATANTISPQPINNTILASTAPQGKQVGIMEINWQPGGQWGSNLNKGDDQQAVPSTYRHRFLAMEKELPDHPEIASLVGELEAAVNLLGKRQAKAAIVRSNSPYLGFWGCAPCHASQMASWQQTRHAKAYVTLEKGKAQFNQDCLPCHVTGIATSQAAEALALPDDRRGVGCETCHGPGRLHSVSPKSNPMARKPGAEICQTCHSAPHDQNFQYDQRIKKVDHL